MSRRRPGSRHHAQLDKRRWAAVRFRVLDGDGWRCQTCGAYGNEVDHVIPLSRGGSPYAVANLQTLCRGCHIEKTRGENERHDPARDAWRKPRGGAFIDACAPVSHNWFSEQFTL